MKEVIKFIKLYVHHFSRDSVMSNSSAIAFYTLFSLPSMMMVIIFFVNIWFADGSGTEKLYRFLSDYLSNDSVSEIRSTVQNSQVSGKNLFESIVGIVILIVSATSLLGAIHESFNQIWGVQTSTKNGVLNLIWSRLVSLGMLLILAFLVCASLLLDAVISNIGGRLGWMILENQTMLLVFNEILSLVFLTIVFAAIFKILPDARIRWKNIWIGSLLTSVFFTIGKFGIAFYLSISDISTTYGAAGSLVIVLLWVYYLTIILLVGAEFTKVITLYRGNKIQPKSYAMVINDHESQSSQPSRSKLR